MTTLEVIDRRLERQDSVIVDDEAGIVPRCTGLDGGTQDMLNVRTDLIADNIGRTASAEPPLNAIDPASIG